MTKRERVIAAIEFKRPDRIPVLAFSGDVQEGDVLNYLLFPVEDEGGLSEWGYIWENLGDGTMGQAKEPPIDDWSKLADYKFPDSGTEHRFEGVKKFREKSGNHFLNAEIGISGFNTYLFLRGFINAMIDFQEKDRRALNLLEGIFETERAVIKKAAGYGFDGVLFEDDWGTQQDLMISPALWYDIFKPVYKRHFDFIHDLGLKVFFHSCGNITSIVTGLHEAGADVINVSQPNVVDIDRISSLLKGRQCFMVPISYQTVSLRGSVDDIFREAVKLYKKLGNENGGFIAHLEDYSILGMSPENYRACWEAFRKIGV